VKVALLAASVYLAVWLAGCAAERENAKPDTSAATTLGAESKGARTTLDLSTPVSSTETPKNTGTTSSTPTVEVPSAQNQTGVSASSDVQGIHRVQERSTVGALDIEGMRQVQEQERGEERLIPGSRPNSPSTLSTTPKSFVSNSDDRKPESFIPATSTTYMPRSAVPVPNTSERPVKDPAVSNPTTGQDDSARMTTTLSQEGGLLSPEDIFELAAPAVVKIVLYDATGTVRGLGSGFFVGGGRIITNAHVIRNAYSGEVQGQSRIYNSITVLKKDYDLDLALLAVEDIGESFLPVSRPTALRPGQRVIAIGNPFGLDRTMSDGLISAIRTLPGGTQILQISAPVSPGSSGGPLLDLNGSVIGVTSASVSDGQNLNFAIGIQTLCQFLEQQDSPQRLEEAGTRVLWRTILKRVGQIVLFLIALVFGGGWFIVVIAVMILGALFALLKGLWGAVARLFRKRRTPPSDSGTDASVDEANLSSATSGSYEPDLFSDSDDDPNRDMPGRQVSAGRGFFLRLMKAAGGAICAVIVLGILVTNALAGLVAAVWLLFLHQWTIVLAGFFLSLTMPYWWLLVGLPGMGLGFLAVVLFERRWWVMGLIPGVFGLIWNAVVLIAWVTGVFLFCLKSSSESTLVPMLLWGYAVAVSPVTYMTRHEPADAVASHMGLLMVQAAYVVLAVVGVLLNHPRLSLGIVLGLAGIEVTLLTINIIAMKATTTNAMAR